MQLGAGRIGVGRRAVSSTGYSAGGGASPAPTNVPGTYGGPPGSFITRSSCPPGYNPVALSRGDIRCVPIPRAVTAPPVPVQPPITLSPTFQQEFTPQFSPVVQQQQDSPGAAQTAAPEQVTTTTTTSTPAEVPEVLPPVYSAPISVPISNGYPIPSTLPTPPRLPRAITAPLPAPEKKLPLPPMKNNYLPFVLIAGAFALFYGDKK